jgi:hypothetical protein
MNLNSADMSNEVIHYNRLRFNVTLRPAVRSPVCLGVKPHLGPQDQTFVTVSCGFDDVGLVWCWSPPAQSVSGPGSCGTHDHILLSQIRDSPNFEGQFPVFIPPRNRVAKLGGSGFPFVASYDSQGYGGGIRTHQISSKQYIKI